MKAGAGLASASIYTDGTYLDSNPSYHVEDSPWKARQILGMIRKHGLPTETVAEIGCGAGEILRQLQAELPESHFDGYDISPQAVALAQQRANPRLRFHCDDLTAAEVSPFDLLLCIDVIEHVDDCFGFVRRLKSKAHYKLFHIPLQVSVQSVLRPRLMRRSWTKGGHVHFFLKETALLVLEEAGCQILDWTYTPGSIAKADRLRKRLSALVRRAVFRIHPDLCVRLFGGYSLLVLAK